ncbi:uncharacterized protein K441DRAFT_660969 [Cenococcum geophilum 1.58]|uniref:uncharacterized protein n=1 Tax=Cenococcum geophilum 1.58 TaxID=794803 RepID=UPI00358F4E5E|nr:hypothetical protein K441DRAFT_660969 [Cenococcum geophilum 1.58]
MPAKKPAKKPAKQALKSTPATLIPLAAPPAGSTRSISNTRACSRTASVVPKASAVNRHNAPFAATSNRGKLTCCVLTYLATRNIKPYYLQRI